MPVQFSNVGDAVTSAALRRRERAHGALQDLLRAGAEDDVLRLDLVTCAAIAATSALSAGVLLNG